MGENGLIKEAFGDISDLKALNDISDLEAINDIYDLEAFDIKLLVDQDRKKVWKVTTSKGIKIWKKVPLSKDMATFIVKVTEYLIKKGLKVPLFTKTRCGKDYYLSPQDEIYLLAEYIEGIGPNFTNHLKDIVINLAKFHKYTGAMDMSSYSCVPDRRGRWLATYQKRQKKLSEIKQKIDQNKNQNRGVDLFSENIDYFLDKIKASIVLLEKSYYSNWNQKRNQKKSTNIGLCHRDFIPQNLMLTNIGDLYVFDFDTLTIDIPAMDLRKIINTSCKEKGKWDVEIVKSIVSFYNSVYRLSKKEWEVVFIDLMYPHYFYSLVNNYCSSGIDNFIDNYNFERLKNTIIFEKSKENLWEDFRHIIE